MKTKNLLPVLAIIFAAGLAFATVKMDNTTILGYVQHPLFGWTSVNVDCEPGQLVCQIQRTDSSGNNVGSPLQVYPEPRTIDDNGNPIQPLESNSEVPFKIIMP